MPPLSHKLKKPVSHKTRHRHGSHHFLAAWIRSPLKIGAFLPSSRALARAMAAQVDMQNPGSIIELGAGTGVMTHALLQAGTARDRLIVIERDERLHGIVCSHFPDLKVLCADAMHLDKVLKDNGVKKINAIVSSLPLLSMPKPVREAIEHQMASVIGEHGIIVQFTYGTRSPIGGHQLRKHHLHGRRTKLVIGNLPPAHVWVYRRHEK